MADTLKAFGNTITRLMARGNLSRAETRAAVTAILDNEQSDLHQGAFLAAITAKGPTPEEIAGAWEAIMALDTVSSRPRTPLPLVDNCGTGMDGFKTFNISTAAAVVAAAGGVSMARHGARAITSNCGTVDVCEALGVDVECPASTVRQSVEAVGIGLYNGMSAEIHPKALFRILSGIRFGSILNIAASLANPASPVLGVRGVYSPAMVRPVARTMHAIGYRRALVFHGASGKDGAGIDELSPAGASQVAELRDDGTITEYLVTPDTAGITPIEDLGPIAGTAHPEEEARMLAGVLTGRHAGARADVVCLNAAPIFYVAGICQDIPEGVRLARDIISSGAAMNTLRQWVCAQQRQPAAGAMTLERLMAA